MGEKVEDALKREVREEAGVEIEIERFLHFKEHFFYYDPLDQAFHSFMMFYLCLPQSVELLSDEQVDDYESERPRWLEIESLEREDFQAPLREVFDLLGKDYQGANDSGRYEAGSKRSYWRRS